MRKSVFPPDCDTGLFWEQIMSWILLWSLMARRKRNGAKMAWLFEKDKDKISSFIEYSFRMWLTKLRNDGIIDRHELYCVIRILHAKHIIWNSTENSTKAFALTNFVCVHVCIKLVARNKLQPVSPSFIAALA